MRHRTRERIFRNARHDLHPQTRRAVVIRLGLDVADLERWLVDPRTVVLNRDVVEVDAVHLALDLAGEAARSRDVDRAA
jgi:hypothetical protein